MELLPKEAQKIEVENATVDFYKYIKDDITYYYFNTSMFGPPEPMVNAMIGLQLLDQNSKLIMINHKPPMGLFPKIQENYSYNMEELENGNHKITFIAKANIKSKIDFSQNTCTG
jgi:hypothetical protein